MIPAFVWEYKLILHFIIRVSSHLKEALCVFGGSTIQEFTVNHQKRSETLLFLHVKKKSFKTQKDATCV
jgi:hypothetical protein